MEVVVPLVSVIITCYNQEAYIEQAIESIRKQTYQNWECWIIDDGSEDTSPAICSGYAAKDNRIHFIRQQNAGVSAARNKGFIYSRGEFIHFLDGDDWILPEKLEKQVFFMKLNPQYGVCYTDHQHYWQHTGSLAHYEFELLQELPLEQLLAGYDRGVSIPIHTALLRRNIWGSGKLPFPEDYTYRYEDWVFWVRIALRNVRFCYLDQSLAIYRMHQTNFITGPEEKAFHSIQAMFYISQVIPVTLKEKFLKTRLHFILSEFRGYSDLSSLKHRRMQKLALHLKNMLRRIKAILNKILFQKQ